MANQGLFLFDLRSDGVWSMYSTFISTLFCLLSLSCILFDLEEYQYEQSLFMRDMSLLRDY
jgi:hypothetical protein